MTTSTASSDAPARLRNRREAADWLAISERKLDQLVSTGKLRCVRIGTCVRFDLADLQAFAESQKTAQPSVPPNSHPTK